LLRAWDVRFSDQGLESSAVTTRKVDASLPVKREFKLPWREAGPPNYHDDNVDSDQ